MIPPSLTIAPTELSWIHRPRTIRKRGIIQARNRQNQTSSYLGGLFTSQDCVEQVLWIDATACSQRKPIFYNCTIESATYAHYDHCLQLLGQKTREKVSQWEQQNPDITLQFSLQAMLELSLNSPLARQKLPGGLDECIFGQPYATWRAQSFDALMSSEESAIFPSVELDHSYGCGVGLHATLEAPVLDALVIHRFFEDFFTHSEQPYIRLDKPLLFDSQHHQKIRASSQGRPNDKECSQARIQSYLTQQALLKELGSSPEQASSSHPHRPATPRL